MFVLDCAHIQLRPMHLLHLFPLAVAIFRHSQCLPAHVAWETKSKLLSLPFKIQRSLCLWPRIMQC